MNNNYEIDDNEKQMLELITRVVLDNIDKNGTDILVGKYDVPNKKRKIKNEFDEFCQSNFDIEPEIQIAMNKYKIKNKEYYQISICSNKFKDDIEKEKISTKKKDCLNDNKSNLNNEVNKKVNITERQLEIIKIINKNPKIKYDDIKKILGISKGTLCIDIKVLKNLKILERFGTTDGKWEINKELLKICNQNVI